MMRPLAVGECTSDPRGGKRRDECLLNKTISHFMSPLIRTVGGTFMATLPLRCQRDLSFAVTEPTVSGRIKLFSE